MHIRPLLLALVSGALIAGPASIGAQPSGGPNGMHREQAKKMWLDLGLTQDQKDKLKALREEMKPVHQEHFQALKAVRDKVRAELIKANPSKATLNEYAKEVGALEQKYAEQRADNLLKVKAIMTAEQFQKMVEHQSAGMGMGNKGCRMNGKKGCPMQEKNEAPGL